MHDTIAFCHFNNNTFFGLMENLWEETANIFVTFNSFTYTAISSFFAVIFRLFFELTHTLFVCTAQFVAFFAIVFWFFSFLYTFFVSVRLENYFFQKRTLLKGKLSTI